MGAKLARQLDVPQDVVHLRLQVPDTAVGITLPPNVPRIIEKILKDYISSFAYFLPQKVKLR